ncbi:MAG: hypothetical protein RJB66_2370 [Pseudomonadota bacterium]
MVLYATIANIEKKLRILSKGAPNSFFKSIKLFIERLTPKILVEFFLVRSESNVQVKSLDCKNIT